MPASRCHPYYTVTTYYTKKLRQPLLQKHKNCMHIVEIKKKLVIAYTFKLKWYVIVKALQLQLLDLYTLYFKEWS